MATTWDALMEVDLIEVGRRRPLVAALGALRTVIVVVNALGWLTTEGVWVYFQTTGQIPPIDPAQSYWERSYVGLVHGFAVADAVWSNLTLLASIVGLAGAVE